MFVWRLAVAAALVGLALAKKEEVDEAVIPKDLARVDAAPFLLRSNETGHIVPRATRGVASPRSNETGHIQPRQTDCLTWSGRILLDPGQTVCFASPGWPGNYDRWAWQQVLVVNTAGRQLRVNCPTVEISGSWNCRQDYFSVYTSYGRLGKYCGSRYPSSFTTGTEFLYTVFRSNGRWNKRGVQCFVTALGDAPTTTTTTTESSGGNGGSGNSGGSCNCGEANSRIVGGVQVEQNEYPWLVGLSSVGGTNVPFCGGSLYNSEWVITAAHCVDGSFEVLLGMHNYYGAVTKRGTAQVIKHPSYNPSSFENDIALVRLSSPVTFGNAIRPVCLPDPDQDFVGQDAVTMGWGTTSSGGSQPTTAREVTVPVQSDATCTDSYEGDYVASVMLCAGYQEGGKDSCQGDSGGPLVVNDAGAFKLAGVVSWGFGCAARDYFGVYAKTSQYISWIQSTAGAVCA